MKRARKRLLDLQMAEFDKALGMCRRDKKMTKTDYCFIGWNTGHRHGVLTARLEDGHARPALPPEVVAVLKAISDLSPNDDWMEQMPAIKACDKAVHAWIAAGRPGLEKTR